MKTFQPAMDRAAIGLSMLCAVHCALMPVALTLLPAAASTPLAGEDFHRMMLLGIVPLSVVALLTGCRRHKSPYVAALGLGGLGILLIAAFAGHHLMGEAGEKIATLVGAATISLGHIQNQRLCRKHRCHQLGSPP